MQEQQQDIIPHKLDGYELIKEIGQGSFSTVYMANQLLTQTNVAVKAIKLGRLNRKLMENLQSEISVLRTISDNKNIVKLIDIVKREKYVYLVMEYCSEGDLSELLREKGGKFDLKLVYAMMVQLSSAMEALHEANLIHRDLKPQNILLTKDSVDGSLILKVADFGFARYMQPSDLAETMCGSPLYMVTII